MERRKYPRKSVGLALAVHHPDCGHSIGRLIDISLSGLMLLSLVDVPINRVYQLALELPEELGCGKWIGFGAESLWSESSMEPTRQWVGFHIIDISDESRALLGKLIEAV